MGPGPGTQVINRLMAVPWGISLRVYLGLGFRVGLVMGPGPWKLGPRPQGPKHQCLKLYNLWVCMDDGHCIPKTSHKYLISVPQNRQIWVILGTPSHETK